MTPTRLPRARAALVLALLAGCSAGPTTPDPVPGDTTAPSVPAGLAATAASPTRIDLAWTASTDDVGIAGYRVLRGGAELGTTTATSYSDAGLTPSTAYAYTVAAYDAAGNTSAASSPAQATTPAAPDVTAPSVPAGLTALGVSPSQVNLAWSASTDDVGVAGYRVYRGGVLVATTTATTHQDVGLTAATAYAYAVLAFDAAGNTSALSAAAQATTLAQPDVTAPSVPANLTATAVSPTRIDLSWSASSDNVGVAGYRVFRGGAELGTTAATAWSDTGLTPSTAYAYTVRAYDGAGNVSAASSPAQATTPAAPDVTAPSVPANLTATAVSPTRIDLSWSASSDNVGVAGYRVFRGGAELGTTAATAWSDAGLTPSTAYAYTVRAYDGAGNGSAASTPAQATTPAAPDVTAPSVPANLTATAVSPTRIDLAWSASTDDVGVAGYRVFRGGTELPTTTATAYSDAGLSPSTAYAYTVRAYDGAGNVSAASSPAQATTPAAPDVTAPSVPANLTATAVSPTRIDLAWSASSDNVGVAGYRVFRGADERGTTTATSYSDTGLNPSTAYTYTVSAFDDAGNTSAASSPAQATTPAAPDVTAPSVPTSLTATAMSPTRIDLAWSASTDDVGVTGYEVRRDGSLVATVAATTYSDTALSPGTEHTYTVSARDAAGNVSAASSPASATTTGGGGGPGTPRLVQHLSSTSNAIGKSIDPGGNDFRFTLPEPVLAGNAIILGVAYGASGVLAATPVTDTNGTWPTAPAATVAGSDHRLAIFVLPNAAAGVHTLTVHFTGLVIPFQYTVSEFSGIATSSPVSGSAGASGVSAPAISSGTFTPANNDADGGNLVWSLFWDDASPGLGHEVTTFTAGPGFTLLDADIGWHDDASVHHASQWTVQAAAAPITPAMSVAMTPANDPFVGLSIALRAANAGTPPGAGMRVVRVLHFTNQTLPRGPFTLQAPSTGNLLVLVTHEDNVITIDGVTDSAGNGWTKTQPETDEPQLWSAASAATGPNLKLTLAIGGTPQPASFTIYDIAGAAAAPLGASAGAPSRDLTGLSSTDDFPLLTPSAPNGIAIAACILGQGPATGFAPGAPEGAIFDFVHYTGQTDGSTMNNSDCRAHVTTTSTAPLHWNWVLTPIPNNSGSATAVHFLAP